MNMAYILTSGGWHHYVLTFKNSTHNATFYIDGVTAGTINLSKYNIGGFANHLVIGKDIYSRYWNGDIDALMLFKGVLTPGNVAYLYNDGKGRELP